MYKILPIHETLDQFICTNYIFGEPRSLRVAFVSWLYNRWWYYTYLHTIQIVIYFLYIVMNRQMKRFAMSLIEMSVSPAMSTAIPFLSQITSLISK